MKRHLPFLAGFAAAIAVTSVGGIIEEGSWPQRKVQVCWAQSAHWNHSPPENLPITPAEFDPFTAEELQLIEALITREFTPQRTGIHFVFQGSCSPALLNQVPIYTSSIARIQNHDSVPGLSTVGGPRRIPHRWKLIDWDREDLSIEGMPRLHSPFIYLRSRRGSPGWKPQWIQEALAITALHEFGHLAGLHHEHLRAESANDPHCRSVGVTARDRMEFLPTTTKLIGRYDPHSIMNYCWTLLLNTWGTDFYIQADEPDNGRFKDFPFDRRSAQRFGRTEIRTVDPSLIVTYPQAGAWLPFRIRIGLSEGDVRALRALYPVGPSFTR